MRKIILIVITSVYLTIFFNSYSSYSQKIEDKYEISFSESEGEVFNSSEIEPYVKMKIVANNLTPDLKYKIAISTDKKITTLNDKAYELNETIFEFTGKKNNEFKIHIDLNKDEIPENDRILGLILEIEILNPKANTEYINEGKNTTYKLTTKTKEKINNHRYLAYLGTNFDLVDGIQANNLFFASNILINSNSLKKWDFGAYFSLYGNRSFTSIDSLSKENLTLGYQIINDTTYNVNFALADRTRRISSDNLGAQFTPLINIGPISDPNNNFQVWLAPNFEFIWRRSETKIEYENLRDSTSFTSNTKPQSVKRNFTEIYTTNQFEWVYGLGFFLNHHSDDVIIRYHFSVGRSSLYFNPTSELAPETNKFESIKDWYFSGKLWITEAVTGITLQAEVFNKSKNPTPYYTVTLSKAFNLSSLGGILQPISSR